MSKDDNVGLPARAEEPEHYSDSPAFSNSPMDVRKYLPELQAMDITEAQKIEFLETLCRIMSFFVEQGWTLKICEQLFGESDESPDEKPDDVG